MTDQMHDEGVLEAGRVIRPYLQRLVGPRADEFDRQLATLLVAAARGERAAAGVRSLLESDRRTAAFLDEVLRDAPEYRPRYVQPGYVRARDVRPLPGGVAPVLHTGKFACPHGDYVWYRPAVGTPIPPCPSHGRRLVHV